MSSLSYIILIMLMIHILLASLGLITSLLSLYKKQMNLIVTSYGFIASGALSGIALLIFGDASVVRVCIEGLAVSSVSLVLAISAQKRVVVVRAKV